MLTSHHVSAHLHVFLPLRDLLFSQVTTEIKVSKSDSNSFARCKNNNAANYSREKLTTGLSMLEGSKAIKTRLLVAFFSGTTCQRDVC